MQLVFSRVGDDRHRLMLGQQRAPNAFQPLAGRVYFCLEGLQKLQARLKTTVLPPGPPGTIGQMVIQLYRFSEQTIPERLTLALTQEELRTFREALEEYLARLIVGTAPVEPEVSFGQEELS